MAYSLQIGHGTVFSQNIVQRESTPTRWDCRFTSSNGRWERHQSGHLYLLKTGKLPLSSRGSGTGPSSTGACFTFHLLLLLLFLKLTILNIIVCERFKFVKCCVKVLWIDGSIRLELMGRWPKVFPLNHLEIRAISKLGRRGLPSPSLKVFYQKYSVYFHHKCSVHSPTLIPFGDIPHILVISQPTTFLFLCHWTVIPERKTLGVNYVLGHWFTNAQLFEL